MNRRTLLKAAGSASALAGVGGAAATDSTDDGPTHEICINAPSDRPNGYPYQFAVTGEIEKATTAEHAPWMDGVVTADPEDDVDGTGCRVHGWAVGGVDCYKFTGDIVAFSVPRQWAHKYRLHVNGQKREPGHLQTQQDPSEVECGGDAKKAADAESQGDGFCPPKNTVKIRTEGNATEHVQYDVAVTGFLELDSGERVERLRGEVKNQAGGYFEVELPYSGELKCLKVEGPGHAELAQKHPCQPE